MPVPDTQRLVLVVVTIDNNGVLSHVYGTGYFITGDLVLTARHVLKEGKQKKLEVRVEGTSEWKTAKLKWKSAKLDAALLKVETVKPFPSPELPSWSTDPSEKVTWDSFAYPVAAKEKTEDGKQKRGGKSLDGTLYGLTGGQTAAELDLGVNYAAPSEGWSGISGAPVFVEGKLVGIIKSVENGFKGKRLNGVPIHFLLRDPGFQVAIAPTWLEPFPQGTWFLVLASEHGSPKTTRKIEAAVKQYDKASEVKKVQVTKALESPERWLQLVQAICKAPVMIVEVTDWEREPAVMLFLGIRSVVRRGVTVTVTAKEIKESELFQLPFNIQESKLISLAPPSVNSRRTARKPEPIDQIGDAIKSGLEQSHQPRYLDLPAYEAVRCPRPEKHDKDKSNSHEGLTALNTILMLCSFHGTYDAHWDYVFDEIQNEAALKVDTSLTKPISMRDISSPRLVGQALYERIRWSPACVVDWTHWRPNVFFELGVRLACSDIGPICVIEESEIAKSGQKQQLFDLLKPTPYKLDDKEASPFEKAFERLNRMMKKADHQVASSPLAHDATYKMIVDWYDWSQEHITKFPHEELQDGIKAQLGDDRERTVSESDTLFASNLKFARQLGNNVQERWIAAWYYFRGRHLPREFSYADLVDDLPENLLPEDSQKDFQKKLPDQLMKSIQALDPDVRDQLKRLIEDVYRVLSNSTDPDHKRIRKEVEALQDVFDELEAAENTGQTDE